MKSARPLALILVLTLPSVAAAHSFEVLDARLALDDDRWSVELILDVDALALGVSPASDDAEMVRALDAMDDAGRARALDRARSTLERRIRLRFDGEPVRADAVEFPSPGRSSPDAPPSWFGVNAVVSGPRPTAAKTVTFFASRSFGAVRLRFGDDEYALPAGEPSPPLDPTAARRGPFRVLLDYLRLGVLHIVPRGADHILFVVGLCLLALRAKPLLIQISAFTLAHTLSLALSSADVVRLPARPVETVIALSIAWVAVENVVTRELKPWRPFLVLAFGLVHGFGFAGVLRELGLPRGRFVPALVGFNLGVEIGQLAVVAAVFAAVGWARGRPWFRTRVVIPGSVAIAAVGLFWAAERGLSAAG